MKKLTIMCYDISTNFHSKNYLPSIKGGDYIKPYSVFKIYYIQ